MEFYFTKILNLGVADDYQLISQSKNLLINVNILHEKLLCKGWNEAWEKF